MQKACGVYTGGAAAIWRAAGALAVLLSSASLAVCLPSPGVLLELPVAAPTAFVQRKAVNREPLCLDFKANVFDVSASFFFVPSCALLTSLSAVASNYWLLIVSLSA